VEPGNATVEGLKRSAAERAVELVQPGATIGLGTGTTARYFIEALGRRIRDGLQVRAVATSVESRRRADAAGISLIEETAGPLDIAVDGADEIDPQLNCIKGRGGALLREKIVAHAARRFILIADASKLVEHLGRGPVPVEVLPFLWQSTSRSLTSLGGRPQLRQSGSTPFHTDNGNLVLDTVFPTVDEALAFALNGIPGVLEHGIFLGLAKGAIIATTDGVRVMGAID
jgi:ribose 5-phosphate isomerase A